VDFFLGVAILTAWDHVPFGTLSAPGNGDQMIHGELTCWELTPTVVAYPFGTFPFPPLGRAQFSRLFALTVDFLITDRDEDGFGVVNSPHERRLLEPLL